MGKIATTEICEGKIYTFGKGGLGMATGPRTEWRDSPNGHDRWFVTTDRRGMVVVFSVARREIIKGKG